MIMMVLQVHEYEAWLDSGLSPEEAIGKNVVLSPMLTNGKQMFYEIRLTTSASGGQELTV